MKMNWIGFRTVKALKNDFSEVFCKQKTNCLISEIKSFMLQEEFSQAQRIQSFNFMLEHKER